MRQDVFKSADKHQICDSLNIRSRETHPTGQGKFHISSDKGCGRYSGGADVYKLRVQVILLKKTRLTCDPGQRVGDGLSRIERT